MNIPELLGYKEIYVYIIFMFNDDYESDPDITRSSDIHKDRTTYNEESVGYLQTSENKSEADSDSGIFIKELDIVKLPPLPPFPSSCELQHISKSPLVEELLPIRYKAPPVTCWTAISHSDMDTVINKTESFLEKIPNINVDRRGYVLSFNSTIDDLHVCVRTCVKDDKYVTMFMRKRGDVIGYNNLFYQIKKEVGGTQDVCLAVSRYPLKSGL